MNSNIFREYDIRGLHETDLTSNVVANIGRALGTLLRRRGEETICIGRDVRTSSLRLKNSIIEGLLSTGMDVFDVGEVPTPALYFSIQQQESGGGVQVTGSHNPIEYNGFKMMHRSESIYGNQIQDIHKLIEQADFETGEGTRREIAILDDYYADIQARIELVRPMKIVIDAGNGCAGELGPKFFRDAGWEVVELYCDLDGTFPNHLPDPTIHKYLVDLIAKVKETGADFGIGYDGDADRIGIIDDKGNIVPGDRLLAIFARDILSRSQGEKIIFDVKCSQALSEDVRAHGGDPVMWKTGHSLIKTKMKEEHAPAAGEMSGHIFFTEKFRGYDDAIYASARFAEIVSRDGRNVSNIDASIPKYVSTPELRVDTSDEEKFRIVDELVAYFKNETEYEVVDVDGVRVQFGDGWGLVRASNTQPVLVMRFEAKTAERVHEIAEIIIAKVREYPSVDLAGVVLDTF
jgi:phosphomannomutase / phosphoglucomutase